MRWQLRPARDLDLPLLRRLRSQRRDRALGGAIVHACWLLAVRAAMAALHRLTVHGRDHLPAAPPFVVVANHASHLDALAVSAALPMRLGRRATVLAAGDTFFTNTPAAAFAAGALNALPVWRQATTPEDLALLRARLSEDGAAYILFPEGTRARDGVMRRFRPGLGALVAGSAVPVIPCAISGAHACWPPQRRLPRPGRIALRFGPALTFEATPQDRAGWQEVARRSEDAVRALLPPAGC